MPIRRWAAAWISKSIARVENEKPGLRRGQPLRPMDELVSYVEAIRAGTFLPLTAAVTLIDLQ